MLTAEPLSSKACRNAHSRKGLTSPLPVAQASHSACDTCGTHSGCDGGCIDGGVWIHRIQDNDMMAPLWNPDSYAHL